MQLSSRGGELRRPRRYDPSIHTITENLDDYHTPSRRSPPRARPPMRELVVASARANDLRDAEPHDIPVLWIGGVRHGQDDASVEAKLAHSLHDHRPEVPREPGRRAPL